MNLDKKIDEKPSADSAGEITLVEHQKEMKELELIFLRQIADLQDALLRLMC